MRHTTLPLLGLLLITTAQAHTFNDIDLSKYDRIDLEPKCVNVTYQYAHDPADIYHKTTAILLPYKLEVETPDGWGGTMYVWNSYNRGPAIELRKGIFNARKTYTAMLSAAGLEKAWSLDAAVGSYVQGLLGCAANGVAGTNDFDECKDENLRNSWTLKES